MSQFVLGIDVGGTKIEVCLLELHARPSQGFHPVFIPWVAQERSLLEPVFYRVHHRNRIPTERDRGYEHVMQSLQLLVNSTLGKLSTGTVVSSVGVGLPGAIDPKSGKMTTGNSSIFVGQNLQSDFEDLLPSAKFRLANDANCFAFAEAVAGVGLLHSRRTGENHQSLSSVGVILGTGCGTGIIVHGQLYSGRHGGAGEAGHTTLVENGRACFCGRKGCAELYISGTGIQMTYQECSGGMQKSATLIFELASQGDPAARQAVTSYCGQLAKFLANLTNILDPDYIVLGGGVSQADVIYQGLEASIKGDLFLPGIQPAIYKNSLGDSAGSLGAAFWSVCDRLQQPGERPNERN